MSESRQHWLDRNRPPRVQITYDVETLGATVKQEIPFVAGIIGDFAGSAVATTPLSGRRFVDIDRDNFDKVMTALKATLTLSGKQLPTPRKDGDGFTVDQTGAKPVSGTLSFSTLEDFGPQAILKQLAEQNPDLKQMQTDRQRLSELLVKVQADETMSVTLTNPRVLDETFVALNDASTQITDPDASNTGTVTVTLGMFGKGAAAPKFDTTKLGADEAEILDAMMAVVTKATAAVTKALGEAKTANDARVEAEKGTTPQVAQETAARAFQKAGAALAAVYHSVDDATTRLQLNTQGIVIPAVPDPDADGTGAKANKAALALREQGVKLASDARRATNALDAKVRRADALVRSAVSQYVRSA
ncbi:MAG TPA: type VI secretion system contractile sheath small subunit [Longimicrobium sp.]